MVDHSVNQRIVIYPTDTVWGIGGAVSDEAAIVKINEIKNTSNYKPQSVMFPSLKHLLAALNKTDEVVFDELFLKNLFAYQVTLAYRKEAFNLELAPSVVCNSEYVCVRVLEKKWIADIYDHYQSPFTTTSLNETGFPPITSREEAEAFTKKNCQLARFYLGEEGVLSGTSSTILKIEGTQVSFWRKGEDFEKLTQLFEQFSLNCN